MIAREEKENVIKETESRHHVITILTPKRQTDDLSIDIQSRNRIIKPWMILSMICFGVVFIITFMLSNSSVNSSSADEMTVISDDTNNRKILIIFGYCWRNRHGGYYYSSADASECCRNGYRSWTPGLGFPAGLSYVYECEK